MITKKMMAEHVLDIYCKDNCIDKNYDDLRTCIYSSSQLAVALEILGKLSPKEVEYSSSRGGIMTIYVDEERKKISILSLREFISILPDSLDQYSGLSVTDILKFMSESADMHNGNIQSNGDRDRWSGMRILIDEVIDHINECEKKNASEEYPFSRKT